MQQSNSGSKDDDKLSTRKKVIKNAVKTIEEETIFYRSAGDSEISNDLEIWMRNKMLYKKYLESAIHRWLSLYILNGFGDKLDKNSNPFTIEKTKLVELLLPMANFVPRYLGLKQNAGIKDLLNLQGANLQEADLQGANLSRAYLQGASHFRAYLQEADLQEADLQEADLQEADLQGANLQGSINLPFSKDEARERGALT
jgi:hypothetical protein